MKTDPALKRAKGLFGGAGAPPRPLLRDTFGEVRALVANRMRARRRPRGDAAIPLTADPAPVLVIPGLLLADLSLRELRRYLRARGHPTYGWLLGVNVGPTARILDGLERRLEMIHAAHRRPVVLIGHSMGGILARDLAVRRPELVRQVITLCSPFRLPTRTIVAPVYQLLSLRHARLPVERIQALGQRLPVPASALYSRRDGVVSWQSCREDDSATTESIEVTATHATVIVDPASLAIVADRLAQPEGTWRAYGSLNSETDAPSPVPELRSGTGSGGR